MKTTFWEKNKRTICNLILVAVLVALVGCVDAFAPSSSMWFPVLRKVCTFALAAVAMNLLNGFTGLFSLGQAGFMLLGAYAYAILTIPVELRSTVFRNYGDSLVQFQMPLVLALLAAGVVAAFFAFLIGLPVLRLKSDYLAIATLGFAEIVRGLVQLSQFGPLTNGPDPLNNFTAPKSVMPYAAIAGVCILLIVLLINSTYGRAFKAIRDDEIAAEAMGINLARHKMISFVVSSFFCGVAGAMLAILGYWTIAWFEKKNWRFAGRDFWLIALSVAMIGFVYRDMLTYSPQIFLFLYIDPFLLSAVAGALMFIASMQLYGRMKTKNGGHAHFPFEKVVLPLTFLTAASAAINYYPY